ncbi:hypothetical protein PQ465_09300 [Sphingobacterium oryzagri]|uniref:YARHG domain-containing protein n=1 Tax=Sphingobacterium oryzagri TaxID=3025669 RepID=A0ABY7WPT2_9SPHI|nr:hypothetical protein [Sphingobacterium sp. KACC 22765]WDF70554.1 hypothetical protein PQ465_09300 [Sphingobacterium sp. KACC 22765]
MFKLIVLLTGLLILGISTQAQLREYRYDQRLAYHRAGNLDTIVVLLRKDAAAPALFSQYRVGFAADYHASLSWKHANQGKTFLLDGQIRNGKYISNNAYKELATANEACAFSLQEGIWELPGYNNCRMYSYKAAEQAELRLYATDRQDNINYTDACATLLEVLGLPTVQLPLGWVVVTVESYQDDEHRDYLMGALLPSAARFEQAIVMNEREIALNLFGTEEERIAFYDSLPHPNYCEAIAWQYQLDEATTARVAEFLADMCSYFNLFGRYDLREFQAYYVRETARRKRHYLTNKLLTSAQATQFQLELEAHQYGNQKKRTIKD